MQSSEGSLWLLCFLEEQHVGWSEWAAPEVPCPENVKKFREYEYPLLPLTGAEEPLEFFQLCRELPAWGKLSEKLKMVVRTHCTNVLRSYLNWTGLYLRGSSVTVQIGPSSPGPCPYLLTVSSVR